MAVPLADKPSEPPRRRAPHPSRISFERSESASLLSPPMTPRSESDVPFKPADSDTISLNMKKNRNHEVLHEMQDTQNPYQVRAPGYCAVATSPRQQETHGRKSRSMPLLRYYNTLTKSRTTSVPRSISDRRTYDDRLRSWTLPSKAAPTRVFTNCNSIVKQKSSSGRKSHQASPAIITLRRATNQPCQESNLTFFPPPTFSSGKGSLFSYISMAVGNESSQTTENLDFLASRIDQSRTTRSTSIAIGPTRLELSLMAEPAFTDVQPAVCFAPPSRTNESRRCSIRYMSRSSMYEILWDPNDTPSRTSQSSPPQEAVEQSHSPAEAGSKRRISLAVEKLESQLLRSTETVDLPPKGKESERPDAARRMSLPVGIGEQFNRLLGHIGA